MEAKILGTKKNIGYVRLKSFNENSDRQFFEIIKKFEKKNTPVGYVIDIRNNPGGLLTQAINITDFFLDDGEIVSTKGRRISETRKFFARQGDGVNGKPIIILINNGSASASEILAGALKDHKRAIILAKIHMAKDRAIYYSTKQWWWNKINYFKILFTVWKIYFRNRCIARYYCRGRKR